MRSDRIVLVALVLLGVSLAAYVYNIDGWLIADDEGTDLYEIWRISEGDVPGIDLITEQSPAFLLGGLGLGLLSDFNVAVLRGASAVLVVGSAWVVFLLGRLIWGSRAGLVGMVLYLTNHLVYTQARLFRPDSWMLAFSVLGLYFFVLAQTGAKRWYLLLSGAMYGVGALCKLFGVLPLGGCLLFLGYRALAGRAPLRRSLEDAALQLVPFVIVSIGGILAFYPPGSNYYSAVIGQHWHLDHQLNFSQRLLKGLVLFAAFLFHNVVFLFALPLLHRLAFSRSPGEEILAWQVPSGLAYLVLSRPIYERYWLYLLPTLGLILGCLVDRSLRWMESREKGASRLLVILAVVLLVGVGVAQSAPIVLRHARLREEDTLALASYVAARTEPHDLVLTDYAGINFHARRPSVYQASIIAGGRIGGGFVTGADLIAEIEARDVKMVLLHVSGGPDPPHHLINLQDFEEFYAYLNRHFCLIDTFNRAGQMIEIYQVCPERDGGSDPAARYSTGQA